MPDSTQTLADLIADRFDVSEDIASDLLQSAPLVAALPMIEASDGTTHKYAKKVGAPTVGFRTATTGRFLSKSSKVLVSADLQVLDWSYEIPLSVANANRKKTQLEHVEEEGLEHLAQAFFEYEKQLINGNVLGETLGFAGFLDAATLTNSDSEMVVNAGGSAVDQATSVYAVRFGPGFFRGVHKGEDNPFEIGDTVTSKIVHSDGTSQPGLYTPAETWLGCELGSKYSIGRICNITDSNPLTDKLISKLISKFPAGRGPTHLLMNRDGEQMLQDSRTATTTTGAPAPFPESAFKREILTTDAIASDEPIVAAA